MIVGPRPGPGARVPSFWRDLMRLQRIGCYSVTAKIDEGGMGEVYRARDTKLNRQVALKMANRDLVLHFLDPFCA